jgi:hypothetical protein
MGLPYPCPCHVWPESEIQHHLSSPSFHHPRVRLLPSRLAVICGIRRYTSELNPGVSSEFRGLLRMCSAWL